MTVKLTITNNEEEGGTATRLRMFDHKDGGSVVSGEQIINAGESVDIIVTEGRTIGFEELTDTSAPSLLQPLPAPEIEVEGAYGGGAALEPTDGPVPDTSESAEKKPTAAKKPRK